MAAAASPDWLAQLDGSVGRAVLLAGGASKEAWAVELDGEEVLVRRAAPTVMHAFTLTLEQEFRVLEVAAEAGVRVPRPIAYYPDLGGRGAFAMEVVRGETTRPPVLPAPAAGAPGEPPRR